MAVNHNELQNVKISDAPRSFDGTRAADAGGDGIDGKLRVFLEKDNSNLLPNGMELIEDLKDKEVIFKKVGAYHLIFDFNERTKRIF